MAPSPSRAMAPSPSRGGLFPHSVLDICVSLRGVSRELDSLDTQRVRHLRSLDTQRLRSLDTQRVRLLRFRRGLSRACSGALMRREASGRSPERLRRSPETPKEYYSKNFTRLQEPGACGKSLEGGRLCLTNHGSWAAESVTNHGRKAERVTTLRVWGLECGVRVLGLGVRVKGVRC